MPLFHTHTHATAPDTQGILIRRAKLYDLTAGFLVQGSDPKIIKLAQIKPGDKVLELGCGPGNLSRAIKKQVGPIGEVTGLDGAPEMIELARRKAAQREVEVDFQVGLIEALPFAEQSFDVVLSRLVIHHLPGDLKRKGFAEMKRVLKPGGICLVADFEPGKLGFLSPRAMTHVDVRTYIPLMEQAGFNRIETGPTGNRLLSFVRGWA